MTKPCTTCNTTGKVDTDMQLIKADCPDCHGKGFNYIYPVPLGQMPLLLDYHKDNIHA